MVRFRIVAVVLPVTVAPPGRSIVTLKNWLAPTLLVGTTLVDQFVAVPYDPVSGPSQLTLKVVPQTECETPIAATIAAPIARIARRCEAKRIESPSSPRNEVKSRWDATPACLP